MAAEHGPIARGAVESIVAAIVAAIVVIYGRRTGRTHTRPISLPHSAEILRGGASEILRTRPRFAGGQDKWLPKFVHRCVHRQRMQFTVAAHRVAKWQRQRSLSAPINASATTHSTRTRHSTGEQIFAVHLYVFGFEFGAGGGSLWSHRAEFDQISGGVSHRFDIDSDHTGILEFGSQGI